jgi:hypothetical protein
LDPVTQASAFPATADPRNEQSQPVAISRIFSFPASAASPATCQLPTVIKQIRQTEFLST